MRSTMPKKEKAMKTTASIANKKKTPARKPRPKKAAEPVGNAHDPAYRKFLERFEHSFVSGVGALFTTDIDGRALWRAYLNAFPRSSRQHYNCNSCRHFIERFGGLVRITQDGYKQSAFFWDVNGFSLDQTGYTSADPTYLKAFAAMRSLIDAADVNGVFFSNEATLGDRATGPWLHLAAINPKIFHVSPLKNAHQAAAEKAEEFKIVRAALAEFSLSTMRRALDMVNSGTLSRPEKIKGPLQWLVSLAEEYTGTLSHGRGWSIIWRAVADAPAGYCHVRSSVVGALLKDISSGLGANEIIRAHAERMDPLQYQRPQAPPKAGNIDRAEKVIAELKASGALERRYAMLHEIEKIWTPNGWIGRTEESGLFSHLRQPTQAEKYQNGGQITFDKFRREVLPQARRIQLRIPYAGNFCGLVTATNADAPPILRWDGAINRPRNPFSWYLYHGGSPATNWGFQAGAIVDVTAVTLRPHMWHGIEFPGEGKGAVFVLRGAQDNRAAHCGNALFPETLRPELREIRATIEAYSKGQRLGGTALASANGLAMVNGPLGTEVIVTSASGLLTSWTIDRWD